MNVLFLDQFSEPGGAQRCLLDLIPAVRDRGWTAHAALPGPGPFADALEAEGVPVAYLRCGPYSSGRKSLLDFSRFAAGLGSAARAVASLLAKHRIDLLYVNGPRLLPAAALAAGRRVPVVFHCHNLLSRGYAARLAGWSLRRINATLIASSRFVAAPLLDYVAPHRCHIVYNGVGPMRGREAPGRTAPRRIGVIGRIAPEKGQAEFLNAARILYACMPEVRYLVCGAPLFANPEAEAYNARLRVLAQGLPVEFTGWSQDVSAVLSGLDLLAVPSSAVDATPRIIMEAFASGVPVVAFRAGGIVELVSDGETGFLVDPPTPEALALRIRDLILAPQRLARAAAGAREAWRQRFHVERYRREVLDLIGFGRLVATSGHSAPI